MFALKASTSDDFIHKVLTLCVSIDNDTINPSTTLGSSNKEIHISWFAPQHPFYKINVDGSF